MSEKVQLSKNVVIEISDEAAQALLQSAEVTEWVEAQAVRIATEAGAGFEHKTGVYAHAKAPRSSAIVYAATSEAELAQAESSALLRAVHP